MSSDDSNADPPRPRRSRDRRASEADLLDKAWELLERDGVLAGLNLNEVASAAGVNRASIYQYFGSRSGLLRAALRRHWNELTPSFTEGRQLPFVERRLHAWRTMTTEPTMARVLALLALDDDPELEVLPTLAETTEALERDQRTGQLPTHADATMIHALTVMTYLGYALFREPLARDLGVGVDELDQRAEVAFRSLLEGSTRTRSGRGSSRNPRRSPPR